MNRNNGLPCTSRNAFVSNPQIICRMLYLLNSSSSTHGLMTWNVNILEEIIFIWPRAWLGSIAVPFILMDKDCQ